MQIISKEAVRFKDQLRELCKIQSIAVCGLFIALYIVLTYFNIKITPTIEIRFAFLILALAGYYGGPVMGLVVGAASDVLSMLLTAGQGSPFFLGFTFYYALNGFLFGLVLYRSKLTVPRIIAAQVTNYLMQLSLLTLGLSFMYGMPLKPLFLTRLLKCTVTFPIEAIMLFLILRAFSQVAVHAGILRKQKA